MSTEKHHVQWEFEHKTKIRFHLYYVNKKLIFAVYDSSEPQCVCEALSYGQQFPKVKLIGMWKYSGHRDGRVLDLLLSELSLNITQKCPTQTNKSKQL